MRLRMQCGLRQGGVFVVCAFTGHRPEKLPWGSREDDPRCLALNIILRKRLNEAFSLGCRTFLCGMARGCDLFFAQAVLELREREPEACLVAMIPCPGQSGAWPSCEQVRYAALLEQCDRQEVLEPSYSEGCMLRRNRAMIDRAQVLISVYDGSAGGTGSTVRYARSRGLTILPVWV